MISGFILFQAKFFVHDLLFRTSKISLNKYTMTVYLSMGKYHILLFDIYTLLHIKVKGKLHV